MSVRPSVSDVPARQRVPLSSWASFARTIRNLGPRLRSDQLLSASSLGIPIASGKQVIAALRILELVQSDSRPDLRLIRAVKAQDLTCAAEALDGAFPAISRALCEGEPAAGLLALLEMTGTCPSSQRRFWAFFRAAYQAAGRAPPPALSFSIPRSRHADSVASDTNLQLRSAEAVLEAEARVYLSNLAAVLAAGDLERASVISAHLRELRDELRTAES